MGHLMKILFDLPNLEDAAEYLIAEDPKRFKDTDAAKEFIFSQVRARNFPAKSTFEERTEPFLVYRGLQALPSEGETPAFPNELTVWINLYWYAHMYGVDQKFVLLPE